MFIKIFKIMDKISHEYNNTYNFNYWIFVIIQYILNVCKISKNQILLKVIIKIYYFKSNNN